MKQILPLIMILSISSLFANEKLANDNFFLRKKPKQEPVVQVAQPEDNDYDEDDDEDEQVVLANIGNMLQSIGMLSTDPTNPAIAGPAIVSFGASVVNIIVQMFKSIDIRRGEITHEQIEQWFNKLPEKTKIELITIMIAFAETYKNNEVLIIE